MLNRSNINRIVLISAAGVFIATLMFFLAYGLSNRSSPTGRSGQQLVGSHAPVVDGELINGDYFFYPETDAPVMVINFWASWCPPCREETPILQRVWDENQDQGIIVLGVNVQDSEEDSLKYLEEFGVTFSNVYDEGGRLTVDYGVTGLPVTFFIDRRGEIVGRWVGAISFDSLSTWTESLLTDVLPVRGNGNNLEK